MFESLFAVIGIVVIFVLGFAGALTPSLLSRFFPKYGLTRKYYFSFFNGIATGVILAVGLIHSLSDAVTGFSLVSTLQGDSYTDQYPWALFIMMMAMLILFTVEEVLEILANRYGIIGFDAHGFSGHGPASHGDSIIKEHHHHTGDHEEHACDHTPEEHKANDGECDAQPLEELCDHHHLHTDRDHSSSQEDEEEGVGRPISSDDDQSRTSSDDDVTGDVEQGKVKPDLPSSLSSSSTEVTSSSASIVSSSSTEGGGESHAAHSHGRSSGLELMLKMIVVFIGLMLHNIFVGLTLGIADNDYVLFIALIFHQFFEGLGMGARVAMANVRRLAIVLSIDFMFALIPVVFIGIGIGIKNSITEAPDSTDGYNIAKGVLQGCSAGVLVYVAVMHMFRAYKDTGVTGPQLDWHRFFSWLGVLFGTCVMSVIGIFA